MRFFIPSANDPTQAEEFYHKIRERVAASGGSLSEKRIYRLKYHHQEGPEIVVVGSDRHKFGAGPVLDPIISIRHVVRLAPNETARLDVVTGAGETREAVMAMAEKYHDPNLSDRVFELAWTHSHVLLNQLNATEADAQVYGLLASSVIYATAVRRAQASLLVRNQRGQSAGVIFMGVRDRDRVQMSNPAIEQVRRDHVFARIQIAALRMPE